MNIHSFLKIVEVLVSLTLIVIILLQQKEGGLGTTFGGGSAGGDGFRTKRGIELMLTRMTYILIVVLIVSSLAISYL